MQSLSYGDVEASVFIPGNQSAYDYGSRCDEEFMQLGLRGVTILVASGDDGIGGIQMQDDLALGCSKAWPEWPGGSPYITSVGATQLTDLYLPGCGQPYSNTMSADSEVPLESELLFQCSGSRETVCSALTGGVITSGGGFSDVNMRATTVSDSFFLLFFVPLMCCMCLCYPPALSIYYFLTAGSLAGGSCERLPGADQRLPFHSWLFQRRRSWLS